MFIIWYNDFMLFEHFILILSLWSIGTNLISIKHKNRIDTWNIWIFLVNIPIALIECVAIGVMFGVSDVLPRIEVLIQ